MNTKNIIFAKDTLNLIKLIENEIKLHGNECSLNHIDTSNIIDMSNLFKSSQFNADISNWDTSKVTNMRCMFANSQFNQGISNWDISNVSDMAGMFNKSSFNQDISKWDTSNVSDMGYMFYKSQFNQDISNWNTSNVSDMRSMFEDCECMIPYWHIKDIELRKEAINKFNLMLKISNSLPSKDITQPVIKKMKI